MRYEAYNDLRFNPNEIDFKILKEKALSESSVDILMLISKLIKSIYAGK
jgi:transposase